MTDSRMILPVCGKCGVGRAGEGKGAPIVMTTITMGNLLVAVFACGNPECGAIHSCQVLQAIVPQQQPSERPLIHGLN